MDTEFKQTFVRLGLEQYLPIFVRSGFSDWHLLCNITESDFGVLGVKRGHRRKIQREIARRHLWPDKDPLPADGIVSSVTSTESDDFHLSSAHRQLKIDCPSDKRKEERRRGFASSVSDAVFDIVFPGSLARNHNQWEARIVVITSPLINQAMLQITRPPTDRRPNPQKVLIELKIRDRDCAWRLVNSLSVDPSDRSEVKNSDKVYEKGERMHIFDTNLCMLTPETCFEAVMADGTNPILLIPEQEIDTDNLSSSLSKKRSDLQTKLGSGSIYSRA
ncbi:hypothetical protein DL98DRAFT_578583 [Cadophora sp. DSE1049]|nr:hypothetical protein DL98DRAFT_578583 [Cadophora sp. DSE1049]